MVDDEDEKGGCDSWNACECDLQRVRTSRLGLGQGVAKSVSDGASQ